MGEVYRARDTKLGRDVAIKVLPESLAHDPERLERLEREAKALAALNHPHIAQIYGLELEDVGDTRALIMEFVDGEDLAQRLARGREPPDEAWPIARQIAEALEVAHDAGIVHRDLKPANIKVRPDGKVKVLDFGLAKILNVPAKADVSTSPTLTASPATELGVVLGTASYMSPEQARGKPVDRRADIWAFGCVLYEMLAARRAFAGDTVTDALAKVIANEPDWTALPAVTPPAVHRLLRRCLHKDPERRLQHAGDARIELEEVIAGASPVVASLEPRSSATRSLLGVGTACLLAGALASVIVARILRPDASAPQVARFAVALGADEIVHPTGTNSLALSRDGSLLAIVGNTDGRTQIYVRRIAELTTKPLAGTQGGVNPIFSPDGQWIAFRHTPSRTIRKVALSGGSPVTICSYNAGYGARWEDDGTILFNGDYPGAVLRVSADGGTPQPVTELDAEREELTHSWPQLLPGGRAVLFTTTRSGTDAMDEGRVELQSLVDGQRKVLVEGGGYGMYSPTGHVVYGRGGTLLAVPFDARRLAVTGPPVSVLDNVSMGLVTASAHYSVAANGTLAYAPGTAVGGSRTMVWVDRQGHVEPVPLPPRSYLHPRISPDGRQIAVEVEGATHDFYTYDIARGVLSRVSLNGSSHWPVWTPDGERLAFRIFGPGGFTMWWMRADRSLPPERLTDIGIQQSPSAWAPDGKTIAFTQQSPETGSDIYVLSVFDRKPRPFVQTKFAEGSPRFSPDGRWIAYSSRESGRDEIYVQAYPGPGPKTQVSTDGGTDPSWSASELFYRNADKMMAAAFSNGSAFTTPRMLWQERYAQGMSSACGPPGPTSSNYDVTPDGRRFLMIKDSETDSYTNQVNVVINWGEELKRAAASRTK
jgi:serine/threonine-protein kinase